MSKPQRMPMKYKRLIEEAVIDLRLLAEKIVTAQTALRTKDYALHDLQNTMRDIEVSCLRIALDLSEIDVASDCDACPSAPSMIKYQAALLAIARSLDGLAGYSRQAGEE